MSIVCPDSQGHSHQTVPDSELLIESKDREWQQKRKKLCNFWRKKYHLDPLRRLNAEIYEFLDKNEVLREGEKLKSAWKSTNSTYKSLTSQNSRNEKICIIALLKASRMNYIRLQDKMRERLKDKNLSQDNRFLLEELIDFDNDKSQ